MPPVAELPLIVELMTDSVPEFEIPPPPTSVGPLPPVTELPLILALRTDSDPALSIPPPSTALPPVMVRPEITTLAPFDTAKTPNAGVPGAPLRATVSTEGPGPEITISVDRSGKALVRVIVPASERAKVMVSWFGARSACSIAARSVPAPESSKLVTRIVAGTTRSSRVSITHIRAERRRTPETRWPTEAEPSSRCIAERNPPSGWLSQNIRVQPLV